MKKTKMLKKNYEFKNVLSKGKYYSGQCIEAFIKITDYAYEYKNTVEAMSAKTPERLSLIHI